MTVFYDKCGDMCEVLRSNFENKYPEIISAINEATFIGLDTELTGISIEKNSLFDTAEERYQILKEAASDFMICQIGLSMFVAVPEENRYETVCYNFYLFPLAQGITDFKFSGLGSCIEFLRHYGFDFNKLFYDGVPYMNKSKAESLRNDINRDSFSTVYKNHDEHKIQELHRLVMSWIPSAEEGDTMEIELGHRLSSYIVHLELRCRFRRVWTHDSDNPTKLIVEKVSPSVRKEKEESDDCVEKLINLYLGFSRVINHMIEIKKPIVGHNLLFDLLMVYQHFYKPLPRNLKTFKKEIHSLFPVIFDTKHIALGLYKVIQSFGLSSGSSSLNELYQTFSSKKGRLRTLYSPSINLKEGMKKYQSDDFFHEAGFDSYATGYVFLRIAHFYASRDINSNNMRPFLPNEHMRSLSAYVNCVNLIRAQIDYINLEGDDPAVKRPPWLILQSKRRVPLNLTEITPLMSQYGNVDLRLRNPYEAFVAVGGFRCAKDILKGFYNHDKYRVSKYNVFRHVPLVWSLLGIGAVVSGGFGIWLLWSLTKQSKSN